MMEKEMSITVISSDTSDSKSSDSSSKKPRQKPRYKGVVAQANGHWGAQIYSSSRIWLGTFKTEDLAAAAYDSAALKLRHGNSMESHRNFPVDEKTVYERSFQAHFSIEQVLNMIKDGSYNTKFGEFLARLSGVHSNLYSSDLCWRDGYFCQELFRKELTPSDVGQLNRLVIPKRYAEQYFNDNEHVQELRRGDFIDTELDFFDTSMKNWRFRYCYWQSSQSYVFTRGWNSFVKDKVLKANDIIAFYELRDQYGHNDKVNKFYMIDIVGFKTNVEEKGVARKRNFEDVATVTDELPGRKARVEEATVNNKEQGFRLFGVHILP